MNNHLFCFGLGYVVQNLTKNLNSWKLSGTHTGKRNFQKNEYLFNDNIEFDPKLLEDATHILISIPPTEDGDLVYLKLHKHIEKIKNLKWIGYISSTSVYGNHNGEWVTEESETKAKDSLGLNRLKAENQWISSSLPANIIRMASIYGPKRSIFDRIARNNVDCIFKENHFFSRIHIDDIVMLLKEMLKDNKTGEIYNFADDFPSPQHELVQYAYKLLNKETPPVINFKDAILSQEMLSYYNNSKKVANNKIKNRYNVELKYPSYKLGLAALIT